MQQEMLIKFDRVKKTDDPLTDYGLEKVNSIKSLSRKLKIAYENSKTPADMLEYLFRTGITKGDIIIMVMPYIIRSLEDINNPLAPLMDILTKAQKLNEEKQNEKRF